MEHSLILSVENNYLTKREGLIYQAYLKPAIKLISESQKLRNSLLYEKYFSRSIIDDKNSWVSLVLPDLKQLPNII